MLFKKLKQLRTREVCTASTLQMALAEEMGAVAEKFGICKVLTRAGPLSLIICLGEKVSNKSAHKDDTT